MCTVGGWVVAGNEMLPLPTNSILICLVGNLFINQESITAKQIVRIKRIPKLLVTYVNNGFI